MAHEYCYMMMPVSRQLSVRVLANGQIRAKHVRHLINMLTLDLDFLSEDEARVPAIHAPVEMLPP